VSKGRAKWQGAKKDWQMKDGVEERIDDGIHEGD
jgi:hypothetical protein